MAMEAIDADMVHIVPYGEKRALRACIIMAHGSWYSELHVPI